MARLIRALPTGLLRTLAPRLALPTRGGAGSPIVYAPAPSTEMPEESELETDDGSVAVEPLLDSNMGLGKNRLEMDSYDALRMLLTGLGLFAAAGVGLYLSDPASRSPFAPKEMPYEFDPNAMKPVTEMESE